MIHMALRAVLPKDLSMVVQPLGLRWKRRSLPLERRAAECAIIDGLSSAEKMGRPVLAGLFPTNSHSPGGTVPQQFRLFLPQHTEITLAP